MAALREEMFRVSLLKISTADLVAWYLCRDREYRHSTAMTIVEAIDQMEITGPTASGADSQFAGEMRFCACSKCRSLFVPNMNPLEIFSPADGIGDAVQRIAGHTVNILYSGSG
jgi:hypothetical protein